MTNPSQEQRAREFLALQGITGWAEGAKEYAIKALAAEFEELERVHRRECDGLVSHWAGVVKRAVAEAKLAQFYRMKKERPIDPVYWDSHEERDLKALVTESAALEAKQAGARKGEG